MLSASVCHVPLRDEGFILAEVIRLLLLLNSSSKLGMLQWEQHQDLSEACASFLIAVVAERSWFALEAHYFKSSL